MDPRYDVLDLAARLAHDYLGSLAERPVGAQATLEELRARFEGPVPETGEAPGAVVDALARDVDGGLIASAGPRYFGFVIGGVVPAALATDWLTSAWDQNAGGWPVAPALSVVEEVAAAWVRDLLGVPTGSGVGFVTGCQMAHFTCLAAARHRLLADAGWDVETDGLHDAPKIRVIAPEQAHVTVEVACRMLGMGTGSVEKIACDDQGRARLDALRSALADGDGPTIVCAQAGEINTGAFDAFGEIADLCDQHGAWCHVDGAFGLWAAVSPTRRALLDGCERADSWATDGHKWLNVPYDCGIAIVADADAHSASMVSTAAYIPPPEGDAPWPFAWTPEFSRRARGVPVYAALRSLGRDGVARLVDGCCDHAVRIASRLRVEPGVEVLNDVVLNQVIVRFGDDDAATERVIDRVQEDGVCWTSGSTFQGRGVMRISVVGWQTTTADAERSAEAILAAARAVLG